jgi:hypothetical protein
MPKEMTQMSVVPELPAVEVPTDDPDPEQDVIASPAAPTQSPTPVLITEQEVMLGSAVAVPLPRPRPLWRFAEAVRGLFVTSTVEARPKRRHYPPRRDGFLEQAAMSREMHRL